MAVVPPRLQQAGDSGSAHHDHVHHDPPHRRGGRRSAAVAERTKLSTTDLANRAITSYEFFDACLRTGSDLIVRDIGTGEALLVRFS